MPKESIEQNLPHISVNAQYIKDLSFENPGVPGSLAAMGRNPHIDLSLDLNISALPNETDFFEVEISIEAKASVEQKTLYIIDLKYAGVFNLINIPEDHHQILLAVQCPAMIFPFARKIIADITHEGGFQPLMIDPIDFGLLYHKKMGAKGSNDN